MEPPRFCPFRKPSTLNLTTGGENSLPIWYHDRKHALHKVSEDTGKFFEDDLDLSRLDRIQNQFIGLRLAGRFKAVARPLHRQLMMNRRVIITEQADLHLTWDPTGIYLKPLPAYLLDETIWTTYLCKSSSLYRNACGLLLSYVWLITRESDFRLAVSSETPLLPLTDSLTWPMWRELVEEFSRSINLNPGETVSPRYAYGELRLDRLNQICRFPQSIIFTKDHTFTRGYFQRDQRYGSFFERNFSWLIAVFAYVTIVLSAMQVGLASTQLSPSSAFQRASSGFAIFAIIVPVTFVGVAIALFVILFSSNVLATVSNWKRQTKKPRDSQVASAG